MLINLIVTAIAILTISGLLIELYDRDRFTALNFFIATLELAICLLSAFFVYTILSLLGVV